jgi:lipopolysaccharide export system permease protein
MRLLDRYILRQFMATFLGLVLGLPLLFVITDLTDNLDKHLSAGIDVQTVALSYVYQMPQFIFYAFPIAALIATVFTIGNMTRHQEIAAAKAGGVSFYRLVAPILILAMLLSGIALVLSEVVPVTNQRWAELLNKRPQYSSSLRMNFVFHTEDGRLLAARRLDAETSSMYNVVIERKAAGDDQPGLHETASHAQWSPENGWLLHNGFLRVMPDEGLDEGRGERAFAFDQMRLPSLEETPSDLLVEPKDPDEMRYAEVTRFIRVVERAGGDIRELQFDREQKISLPLAVLVIVLFGAPLATSSKRGGAAYGIGISLAITIVYLMLFRVGKAFGSSGAVDPILAAWLPNALFLVAGLILLSRVRT